LKSSCFSSTAGGYERICADEMLGSAQISRRLLQPQRIPLLMGIPEMPQFLEDISKLTALCFQYSLQENDDTLAIEATDELLMAWSTISEFDHIK